MHWTGENGWFTGEIIYCNRVIIGEILAICVPQLFREKIDYTLIRRSNKKSKLKLQSANAKTSTMNDSLSVTSSIRTSVLEKRRAYFLLYPPPL